MEANRLNDRQLMVLVFGVPLLTAVIVVLSMYAGYTLTRLDKPTQVTVTAAPPQIQFAAPAPQVSIQVPPAAPPTVNVSTPPAAVTVIERPERLAERSERMERSERKQPEKESRRPIETASAAPPAPPIAVQPVALRPVTAQPAKIERQVFMESAGDIAELAPLPETKKVESAKPSISLSTSIRAIPVPSRSIEIKTETAAKPARTLPTRDEATLDTLYQCATGYIESYCKKQGLDPASENRRWDRKWRAGLDQAMADNIDTCEQSYINRIVIAKRDYFNVEKTSPDKVVEACHLLLRYREGQLAWLQAMKDAMTQENLNKTVAFLAAGPR